MADHNTIRYSVVIPVYNSEGSLMVLYERLERAFRSLEGAWELVLVDDSSRDGSWNIMRNLAEKDRRVTAIHLTNNFGQHNALMCGFSYARGDYAITMDDDLQHPPEEIAKLVKAITEGGYSVVYGQYLAKKHGWFRDVCSNAVNNILSKITGSGYKVTSFRIIKKSVIEKLSEFTQYNVMIDVLVKDIVNKRDIGHAWVEHHPRIIGASNYSLKKLFMYALNMIFNYTLWPLRFAAISGLLVSCSSILLGAYFLISYFVSGVPVRGFTSIIVMVAFLFGFTIFVLGIIGEYLGRIFLNINRKPQYVVKEVYKK